MDEVLQKPVGWGDHEEWAEAMGQGVRVGTIERSLFIHAPAGGFAPTDPFPQSGGVPCKRFNAFTNFSCCAAQQNLFPYERGWNKRLSVQ